MAIKELKAQEVTQVSGGEWWDSFAYGSALAAALTYSFPPVAAYIGGAGAAIGLLGNLSQGQDFSDLTFYNAMGDFTF